MSEISFIRRWWPERELDLHGDPIESTLDLGLPKALSPRSGSRGPYEIFLQVVDEIDLRTPLAGMPYLVLSATQDVLARGLTDAEGRIEVGLASAADVELRVANVVVTYDKVSKGNSPKPNVQINPYIPAQRTPVSDVDLFAAMQILWPEVMGKPLPVTALRLILAHHQLETGAGRAHCFCYNLGNRKATPTYPGYVTYYQGGEEVPRHMYFDFSPGEINRFRAYPDLRAGLRDYLTTVKHRAGVLTYVLADTQDLDSFMPEMGRIMEKWLVEVDVRNARTLEENRQAKEELAKNPTSGRKIKPLITKKTPEAVSQATFYALALWDIGYYTANPVEYANSLHNIFVGNSGLSLKNDPIWPTLPALTHAGCDPRQSLPPPPAGIRPTAPLPPPAPFVDPPPGDHGGCELKNNNCKVVYAKHLDIEVVDASGKKIRRKWTDGDPVAPPLTTGGPLYIGKLTPRSTTAQEAGAATPQLLPFPKPGPLPVKLSLQTTEGLPLDGYPIALRRENGEEQAARTDAEGVANFKVQGSGWAAVLTDAGSASPRRTLAGDPFRPEEVGDDEVRQRRVQPLPGPTGLCAELGEYKQGNRLLVPKGGR